MTPEELLQKYRDEYESNFWYGISRKKDLTEGFVLKYQDKLDFSLLRYELFSLDFLLQFYERLDWDNFISVFRSKLTDAQIIEHADRINFYKLCLDRKISIFLLKSLLPKFELYWFLYSGSMYSKEELEEISEVFKNYEELI